MVGGWNLGERCEPLVSAGCGPAGKIPVSERGMIFFLLYHFNYFSELTFYLGMYISCIVAIIFLED
jgi:hypothetical protein